MIYNEPVCDQGLGKAAGASDQAAALKELLIVAKSINPHHLRLDAAIRQAERVFYIDRKREGS